MFSFVVSQGYFLLEVCARFWPCSEQWHDFLTHMLYLCDTMVPWSYLIGLDKGVHENQFSDSFSLNADDLFVVWKIVAKVFINFLLPKDQILSSFLLILSTIFFGSNTECYSLLIFNRKGTRIFCQFIIFSKNKFISHFKVTWNCFEWICSFPERDLRILTGEVHLFFWKHISEYSTQWPNVLEYAKIKEKKVCFFLQKWKAYWNTNFIWCAFCSRCCKSFQKIFIG